MATSLILIAVLVASCEAPAPADESYVGELRPIAFEANVALGDMIGTLLVRTDSSGQLYQRIVDLRLPGTYAVLIDKAQRVEPPPEFDAHHERYLQFLAEMLGIVEDLDFAVASEDFDGIAVSFVRARAAEKALAVSLPPEMCQTIAPAGSRNLCAPADPYTGYVADLDIALRRFVARYEPATQVPIAFGNVIRSRLALSLQPEVSVVIADTIEEVSALGPPGLFADPNAAVIGYLRAIQVEWDALADASTTTDPILIGVLEGRLLESYCRTITGDLATTTDLVPPEERLGEALSVWFGDTESCATRGA